MSKPETLLQRTRGEQIGEVAFRRLLGEFTPSDTLTCDAGSLETGTFVACGKPAICWVGGGLNHPSCEQHAQGESYVCGLDEVDA